MSRGRLKSKRIDPTSNAKVKMVEPHNDGSVSLRWLNSINPSPENEKLYRPVDPADPEVQALADSIRTHGVQEPLVISADDWIISGHRRHAAARLAGKRKVPCIVNPIRREDDLDGFLELLRECNRQRVKSLDEKLREEVVSADPEEAYQSLLAHREEQSRINVPTIELRAEKRRSRISKAKLPMLMAVQMILEERRTYWPLTDRQIHYALLNDPPPRNASKPDERYANCLKCYQDLCDLLTRARLETRIPWDCIVDETRPVMTWPVHADVQGFIRAELDGFLKNYWRDYQRSQPCHLEIVGEKMTLLGTIKPVAARYCIPMTIGRGFSSLDPRYKMVKRFERSGKDKLVVLILSDFDPDGDEIAHSFARSLRDDFFVDEHGLELIKVALTSNQVAAHNLPPIMQAKKQSSNYKRFAAKHGENVWELEALPPSELQRILTEAINSVLNLDLFNRELDQEKADAVELATVRRRVHDFLTLAA